MKEAPAVLPPLRIGESRTIELSIGNLKLPREYIFVLDGNESGVHRTDYLAYLFWEGRRIGFFSRRFVGGPLSIALWPDEEYQLLFLGEGFAPVLFEFSPEGQSFEVESEIRIPVKPSSSILFSPGEEISSFSDAIFSSTELGVTWSVRPSSTPGQSLFQYSRGLGEVFDKAIIDGQVYQIEIPDSATVFLSDLVHNDQEEGSLILKNGKLRFRAADLGGSPLSIVVSRNGVALSFSDIFPLYAGGGGWVEMLLPLGEFDVVALDDRGGKWVGSGDNTGQEWVVVNLALGETE
jgi:hypothetical protein